jgi:hypothetical protein
MDVDGIAGFPTDQFFMKLRRQPVSPDIYRIRLITIGMLSSRAPPARLQKKLNPAVVIYFFHVHLFFFEYLKLGPLNPDSPLNYHKISWKTDSFKRSVLIR